MTPALTLSDIQPDRPDMEEIAARYRGIEKQFSEAADVRDWLEAVQRWDAMRREFETWGAITQLRFHQDTRNADYKREREFFDEVSPKFTDFDVRVKKRLLSSRYRPELENKLGKTAFSLWEADVLAFDPVIEPDLVQQSKLEAEYSELCAAADLEFEGEKYNLSGIVKFRDHADRDKRYAAEKIRWQWFADNRQQLDRIFDDQVKLRHQMAQKLGFDNYVGLAYKQMKRIDYNEQDVANFRAEVRDVLVPLAVELRKHQADALGVDKLMFWDDNVHDRRGNPAPQGDHDWMVDRAVEMFDQMGNGLGEFFRLMIAAKLTDLKNREGKSPGGFCCSFPKEGLPFIFANFNGTKGDVEVFTHEMGHAFQCYQSRNLPLFDYLWPTFESCEIHSMGLEFLTWPHMDKFFGADADRFRRLHLTHGLTFIPYGVAVDHFQHLVYQRPEATPEERHAMWQEMERTYLPWRDYGDLPHVGEGGFWQMQRHIYLSPFYYIDYTLAQTCALQLWASAQEEPELTMAAYVALCKRGGEAPFQELARSAGLVSPFQTGSLRAAVDRAAKYLQVA